MHPAVSFVGVASETKEGDHKRSGEPEVTRSLSLKKKRLDQGERRPPDFRLKKMVP